MNKNTTNTNTTKLSLVRETIQAMSTEEAQVVAGGAGSFAASGSFAVR